MRTSLLEYFVETANDDRNIAFRHRPRLRVKWQTYSEVARAAFQFARELDSRNIGKAYRVVIWSEHSPEWVAAFWGILLPAAIAAPLDENSSPEFAQRVFHQTTPNLVLVGNDIELNDESGWPTLHPKDMAPAN